MDLIYQIKQFHRFYPVEALDIAALLAFVPYLLIRRAARRVAGWYLARSNRGPSRCQCDGLTDGMAAASLPYIGFLKAA